MPNTTQHILDTLQCDSVLVQDFQQKSAYEYHREFIQQDLSLLDRIEQWFRDLFNTTIDRATQDNMEVYWIIGGLVLLIAAVAYISTHDVSLFRRSGKDDDEYEVEDEDIYSIDFDDRINEALKQRDWREATRLTHLKTLRWLADNGRIQWALFKTPLQYTYEERSTEFREMTNEFLKVRYGNFVADESTFQLMNERSRALIARISDEIATTEQQEGGDA